jgi:hypothetical protein
MGRWRWALGTWLVFGPGWLGESSVVPGMRYAHGTIDAHTTRMLDGGAGQRNGVLRGEGRDVCASLAVAMLELERGRREWSLTGRTWAWQDAATVNDHGGLTCSDEGNGCPLNDNVNGIVLRVGTK